MNLKQNKRHIKIGKIIINNKKTKINANPIVAKTNEEPKDAINQKKNNASRFLNPFILF